MSDVMNTTSTRGELDSITVAEAMHTGILTCPLEASLRDVARMMALYRVHAIVAFGEDSDDVEGAGLWGVISDLDLVRAAVAGEIEDHTAGGIAATPALLIAPDDTLHRAARLMSEHEVTHAIVVDPESARPVGVLSTLDVARVLSAS
jgi:CBS domain-containing protein